MKSGMAAIDRWLFAAAPAERLAMLRILCGLFGVTYAVVRAPAFVAVAAWQPSQFEPVGVLAPLDHPVPYAALTALLGVAIVLGVAYTAGAWFRLTGPGFAMALLLVTTYHSSWGQLLHFENLLVLHVVIVGFARSADALAVGPRRLRSSTRPDPAYGWPVRLAALVTVATYVLAGWAKLRLGGMAWITGDTLRNHVAYSAARLKVLGGWPSPVAGHIVGHAWLFTPLALAAVVLELAAPVALIGPRLRNMWVLSAWLMHVTIAVLMFVVFPYPLFLVAFAPLYPLERVPVAIREQWGKARPAAS
jgi:hypothetical protein